MFYSSQGVKFCPYFPQFTDFFRLCWQGYKDPHTLPFFTYIKNSLGVKYMPPFSGTFAFGMPLVMIADPDALQELYITKNSAYTKHPLERQFGQPLMFNNILAMETEDPSYAPKKRVLSSSFYKGKVQEMVTQIKETTLDQFTKLQAQGEKVEVDLVKYTQTVQAHIIMNTMCGRGESTKKLPYAGPGMVVVEKELADYIDTIVEDILARFSANPLIGVFPSLYLWQITEVDKRFFKNCATLRSHLREIVKRYQANPETSNGAVIAMLAADPLYKDNVEDIIDDVIVMFIAGSKTVQATTTNFFTHMLHRPEVRAKVDAELSPFLDKCKENFMELMTTEAIEDLDYLRQCFYEVLRYDTPIPAGSTSCFSRDVTIRGINFKKGDAFYVAMSELHRNPKEWVEPDTFNPDRFDSSSTWFKRPDGTNRNSMAFNPFLGGKRVCLGKTFAETVLKFTLPLFWHHFNIEFATEEHKTNRPHLEILAMSSPVVPVHFITKNKVNQNFRDSPQLN